MHRFYFALNICIHSTFVVSLFIQIKLLEQQAQADAQKEIQDVRVKEQQQHWEQRCQLLDEAATASRNYEANMQELRNQMKVTLLSSIRYCRHDN